LTWNYRVMIRDGRYAVHAVYYADDGRIMNWSAEPMDLSGASVEDLSEELERFHSALLKPVLDYDAPELKTSESRETDA
jgi:hypothetical protein